jgi:hypothetical protein
MPLSDIILPAGQAIVTLSSSSLSLAANGIALNFGTVQRVNQISDKLVVGQSIMFDKGKAIPFMIISGTTFFLINEDDITLYETALP